MAKALDTWTVHPHRPIDEVSENIWCVEGDAPGIPLKRVMTLARLTDGTVAVHSAIALEDDLMQKIEAWGRPAHLLVPNGYHRLDAKIYAQRYPELKVYCPSGSRSRVAEVVAVDGAYEDFPKDDRVSLLTLDGTASSEGAMVIRDGGEITLVLNDAVFNMPHVPGVQGFVLRHVAKSSGGPRISRVGRILMVKDKPAFIAQLERFADLPGLSRVIVSHHEPISDDPAGTLKKVAASLR
jgi:hypothetical protein